MLCISGLLQFIFAFAQPYFTNFAVYSFSLLLYGMFASGMFSAFKMILSKDGYHFDLIKFPMFLAGTYVTAFVMSKLE